MRRRSNLPSLCILGFVLGVLFTCLVPIRVILFAAVFVVVICCCCHR